MTIQSESNADRQEFDPEEGLSTTPTPAENAPDDEVLEPEQIAGEEDADVARTITLTPGCVFGVIAVAAMCVVLTGAGLWFAGRERGIGPFASMASGRASGAGQVPATTVASVNGEPITTEDLDNLLAINMVMTAIQGGQQMNLTPEQRKQARMELLNQAIRNTLILQAARSAGLAVSAEQAQAEWLAWVRRSGLTPDQLDAELAKVGTSREAFQQWLGNALVANQYLSQYVAQGSGSEDPTQAYEEWMKQQLETAQIQLYQQQPVE
ncbi:MAG: Chaperone SurA [Anaerolineales bacterium]|nr:Chaperone SurA [Anaerolineales bacterium]